MEKGQVFGMSTLGLLATYDHDSQSWRTLECSLFGDFMRYSDPLPRSGIMLNGRIYAQRTWVRRIEGKESGLWPTPTGSQARSEGMIKQMRQKVEEGVITKEEGEKMIGGSLTPKRMPKWRTPDTCQGGTKSQKQYLKAKKTGCNAIRLQDQVKWEQFPTPQASDGQQGEVMNDNTKIIFLKSGKPRKISNQGISGSVGLSRYVQIQEKWPTPRASEYKGVGPLGSKSQKHMKEKGYLCAEVQYKEQCTGQLNPTWVDWLMGYPIGWTDLKASGMQLSLK